MSSNNYINHDNGQTPPSNEDPLSTTGAKAVCAIMSNVISSNTSENYNTNNVGFVWWLIQSSRYHLIEGWALTAINNKTTITKKKKKIKALINAMYCDDNNSPVILSDLTFEIFSEYLATKKVIRCHRNNSTQMLSKSTYDLCQSALMHMFKMSKYDMSEEFAKKLSRFMAGLKQKVSGLLFHFYYYSYFIIFV